MSGRGGIGKEKRRIPPLLSTARKKGEGNGQALWEITSSSR